jgi:hypothetical protein
MGTGLVILTIVHVAISLIGIGSGFVMIYGFVTNKRFDQSTAIFLATTILTSLTGFLFPIVKFTPALAIGMLSLIALGVAVWSLYRKHLAGGWRAAFVVTAMISQYFNFAILIIQSFQKVPPLHNLAPTQSEPPFAVTQLTVLVLFIALTVAAIVRFRPATAQVSPDERKTFTVSEVAQPVLK